MTGLQAKRWERVLAAFAMAGVVLILASWAVTGVRPGAPLLVPVTLFAVAWLGTRATPKADGERYARR